MSTDNKNLSVVNCFFGQKDIRTKGDMGMECLVGINLMFLCSFV